MPKERLDSAASAEATRVLNVTLAQRPAAFAKAFRDAEAVAGRDIDETHATIAQLWLSDYGAGTTPERAKLVANATLGNSTILRSLSRKTRFSLTNMFFPHFNLPRGWRTVAEAGQVTKDQIAALIMERLRMIDEGELDVNSQHDFVRMLLSRPRNASESYREIMSRDQLDTVVQIVTRRTPTIYRQTRAETIGWRLGPIG